MRRNFLAVFLLIMFCNINTGLFAKDNRNVKTLHLSKISFIDGYYCKGWISTTRAGRLISFDNAAPIRVLNGLIPFGSRVGLYPNLKVESVSLGKPTTIQGLPCIGYGTESPVVSFYQNGRIRFCYLSVNTKIQGILCHGGSFSRVVFGQDGKLYSCELAKTQTIQGKLVKARSLVYFDTYGKIKRIRTPNIFRSLLFDTLDKIM